MKKAVAVILALIFCLSFAACGDSGSAPSENEGGSNTAKREGLTVSDLVEGIEENLYTLSQMEELSVLEEIEVEEEDGYNIHLYSYFGEQAIVEITEKDGYVEKITSYTELEALNLDGSFSREDLVRLGMGITVAAIAPCHKSGDTQTLQKIISDKREIVTNDNEMSYCYEEGDWYYEMIGDKGYTYMGAYAVSVDSEFYEDSGDYENSADYEDEPQAPDDPLVGDWSFDYAMSRTTYEKYPITGDYTLGMQFSYESTGKSSSGSWEYQGKVEGLEGYVFTFDNSGAVALYLNGDTLAWANDEVMFYYKRD